MEFEEFKRLHQGHIAYLIENADALFVAGINKDEFWELYLNSFPPGTNEIYRERREYDCSCCRHYIKQFGNIVAIVDYKPVSIWSFQAGDDKFQPVLDALSGVVESAPIVDVLVTKESAFGTDKSHEQLENGDIHTWHHFRTDLPDRLVLKSHRSASAVMANYRDVKTVFKRSLEEISRDAIETVLDLIAEKMLYRGEEWRSLLQKFLALHDEYHDLEPHQRDPFCWIKSVEVGGAIGKIRNHSIGTLLINVSDGVDLDEAVRKYESIIAPINYKRPRAIFSKKMVEQAEETVNRLGLLHSLERRHAVLSDVTINNVLWANRDAVPYMNGGAGVFESLKQEATEKPSKFDNIPGVSIEQFIESVLPDASSIEVLFENRHESNLMTVIAPQNRDSKTMFKWNNNFSWAYNGNITDSMKERVKSMGGKVDGVLRLSLQWNHNDDLDIHCLEPGGRGHIYFSSKGRVHPSSGMLDVDIIQPRSDRRVVDGIAVENIIYTDRAKMPNGRYNVYIHCYSKRDGATGFQAELEYDSQIYHYDYSPSLRRGEKVHVVQFSFSKEDGVKIIDSLPSSAMNKTIWNLTTNQFHPVTTFMFSPNYWDEQSGTGHKHYFFIIGDCKTEDRPNGFFNEFLKEDLMDHKRVFEALGSKMKVDLSDEQLSGLGFSSSKRGSIIVRVDNQKVIRVVF